MSVATSQSAADTGAQSCVPPHLHFPSTLALARGYHK